MLSPQWFHLYFHQSLWSGSHCTQPRTHRQVQTCRNSWYLHGALGTIETKLSLDIQQHQKCVGEANNEIHRWLKYIDQAYIAGIELRMVDSKIFLKTLRYPVQSIKHWKDHWDSPKPQTKRANKPPWFCSSFQAPVSYLHLWRTSKHPYPLETVINWEKRSYFTGRIIPQKQLLEANTFNKLWQNVMENIIDRICLFQ